jgi:hypothetical protein
MLIAFDWDYDNALYSSFINEGENGWTGVIIDEYNAQVHKRDKQSNDPINQQKRASTGRN